MPAMKLSVSVSDDEVEFMDRYAGEHGVPSRSGVVQRALSLLRANELSEDYSAAWSEWDAAGADAWDATTGDGIDDRPDA
jgi:Arc/MetJ-type ribon-helix-helix transcriptional regulator